MLTLTRAICGFLPPLIAQRVRSALYPFCVAAREDRELRGRAVTGGAFLGRSSDFHAYRMAVHGSYDWRNVAICEAVCRKGGVVIEVGANVGTKTLCFADIVGPQGRVIACEPDQRKAQILRNLADLNAWRHVEILTVAVGDSDGEVSFKATREWAESGMGHVMPEVSKEGAILVKSIRLDTLKQNVDRPGSAISIDVEGYELKVLQGGRKVLRNDRPVVVLEASPRLLMRNGWCLRQLAQELSDARFICFTIGRLGLKPPDLSSKKASNWLCLPVEKAAHVRQVERTLCLAGWMPMISGLNPLARRGRREWESLSA